MSDRREQNTVAISSRLWLASASPRRFALLTDAGYQPVRIPPEACQIDEAVASDEDAADAVVRLAQAKARQAFSWSELPADAVVLAGDTVVAHDGHVLGKPADRTDAVAMLTRLSGSRHEVLTAIAVAQRKQDEIDVRIRLVCSTVWFSALTPAQIAAYVATGEPDDKAGAYAIQGLAGQFVDRIDGSCSGVVGLPLSETRQLLNEFDVVPDWLSGAAPTFTS